MNVICEELEVRQMKENKTDNKLDTRLAHSKIAKTCTPKFKLKFTDFAVEKFTANFIITLPDGSIKTKPRAYVPFDVSRHTSLKGLRLFPSLTKDDIRCAMMSENGADIKLMSLTARKLFPYNVETKNRKDFKTIYKHYRQTKGHGPFEPRSPFKFEIKTIKCNILK